MIVQGRPRPRFLKPGEISTTKGWRQRQEGAQKLAEDWRNNWLDPEKAEIRRIRGAQLAEQERLERIRREREAFHAPVPASHLTRYDRMHRSRLEFIERCLREAGAPADLYAPMPGAEDYVIPPELMPNEDTEIYNRYWAQPAPAEDVPEPNTSQDDVSVDEDAEPVRRGRGRPPKL